jgi:hypothetical protein
VIGVEELEQEEGLLVVVALAAVCHATVVVIKSVARCCLHNAIPR